MEAAREDLDPGRDEAQLGEDSTSDRLRGVVRRGPCPPGVVPRRREELAGEDLMAPPQRRRKKQEVRRGERHPGHGQT